MSTTVGARHVQTILALGLEEAVKKCVIEYDREKSNGNPHLLPVGAINAVLISIVGDTVATMLASQRCLKYRHFPLWKQRLVFKVHSTIAATFLGYHAARDVFRAARNIGKDMEAKPNWFEGHSSSTPRQQTPGSAKFH